MSPPVLILNLRTRALHVPTCGQLRRTHDPDRSHRERVLRGFTAEDIERGELRPPVRFHSCMADLWWEIEHPQPLTERLRQQRQGWARSQWDRWAEAVSA